MVCPKMKPDFALSLSADGITLLRRADTGWFNLGTALFTSEDLPADLASLRQKGEASGHDLLSKLIIPDDQIKYLTLDTGDANSETRFILARAALEGATPYAVEQLAFDLSEDGSKTHVAAVALETLEEAESFAVEHKFGPVSFVANPTDHDFVGEPFFGTTRAIRGTEVSPDETPVVDLGPPPVAAEPTEAPEDTAPNEGDDLEAMLPDDLRDLFPAKPEPTTGSDPEMDPSPEAAPTPQLAKAFVQDFAGAIATDTPAHETAGATGGPVASATVTALADQENATEATQTPIPQMRTISEPQPAPLQEHDDAKGPNGSSDTNTDTDTPDLAANDDASATGIAQNDTDVTQPPANASKIDTGPSDEVGTKAAPAIPAIPSAPKPLGAAPAEGANAAAPVLGAMRRPENDGDTEKPPYQAQSFRPVPPPQPSVASQIAAMRAAAQAATAAQAAQFPTGPQDDTVDDTPKAATSGFFSKRTLPPAPKADAVAGRTNQDDVPVPTTLGFAAGDTKRDVGGKPRYLLIILTGLLLLFMVAVAAVALWSEDEPLRNATPAGTLTPPEPQDLPAAAGSGHEETVPVAVTPAQNPQAPADLNVNAQPSVSQPETDNAAQTFEAPRDIASQPERPAPTTPASTPLSAPTSTDRIASQTTDLPETLAFADPSALARTRDVPLDLSPEALTEAAKYAATGIWQGKPEVSGTPSMVDLEQIHVASIDGTDLTRDAIALPVAPSFNTDIHPNKILEPATPKSKFDLDDRGLVKATPNGTVNPDGITIYLGRPAKVPPARPAPPTNIADAAPESEAPRAILTSKRPRSRPAIARTPVADSSQQVEETRPNVQPTTRPRVRPSDLKVAVDQAIEDVLEQELAPLDTGSALAVRRSKPPLSRPSNFAALVERTRKNPDSSPIVATVAVPAAAAIVPRQPSGASVSRQATIKNAINLRKLNLIGVYGSASNRRAKVRMPSGRFKDVKVGDSIDGGRVVAIGTSQLRYQKRGRDHTLKMPNG